MSTYHWIPLQSSVRVSLLHNSNWRKRGMWESYHFCSMLKHTNLLGSPVPNKIWQSQHLLRVQHSEEYCCHQSQDWKNNSIGNGNKLTKFWANIITRSVNLSRIAVFLEHWYCHSQLPHGFPDLLWKYLTYTHLCFVLKTTCYSNYLNSWSCWKHSQQWPNYLFCMLHALQCLL